MRITMFQTYVLNKIAQIYLGIFYAWNQYILLLPAFFLFTAYLFRLYSRVKNEGTARKSNRKLNCWFCNENVDDQDQGKESWKCPYCEQYNGFTKDGNYNQLMIDQFDVKDYRTPTVCSPSEFTVAKSVLCNVCSQNQVLKVRQLATFEPFDEANYNDEVSEYKDYLERRYSLCNTCRCQVSQYLAAQDKKLASTMTDAHIHILDKLAAKKQQESKDNHVKMVTSKQQISSCMIFRLCLGAGIAHTIFSLTWYTASLSAQSSSPSVSYISHLAKSSLSVLPESLSVWGEQSIVSLGALLCAWAIWTAGKYSLYPEDAVHLILWLLLVLMTSNISAIPLSWLSLTRKSVFLASAATLILSVVCCLRRRSPRNLPAVTINKKHISSPDIPARESVQKIATESKRNKDTKKVDTSPSPVKQPLPCFGEGSDITLQFENVQQDLGCLSLGLTKKSGSTSSIWSLPAIVSASTSLEIPDSTSDQSAQKSQGLISPSRLGFLNLESVSRDGQGSFTRNPVPWSQAFRNFSSQANINNNSQNVVQAQQSDGHHHLYYSQPNGLSSHKTFKSPISSNVFTSPSCDNLNKSAFRPPISRVQQFPTCPDLGPCDSQTPDSTQTEFSNSMNGVRRHQNGNQTGKETNSWRVLPQRDKPFASRQQTINKRNIEMQSVDHMSNNNGLRRSQRIAMIGKLAKPWPLKKALSCTNIGSKECLGESRPWRDTFLSMPTNNVIRDSVNSIQKPYLSPIQEAATISQVSQVGSSRLLPHNLLNKHDRVSEFSDDDEDNETLSVKQNTSRNKEHTKNDFPWAWMVVGLVLGASLTANFFLACQGWWSHAGQH